MEGQSKDSIEDNISFFQKNLESYNKDVQNLDSYITIRAFINQAIRDIDYLLDVGNGGVFDYDVNLVEQIVGLDLFLDKLPTSFSLPSNGKLKTGSALNIPDSDNIYDGVLMAFLIHHIIGKTVKTSIQNVERAISEAHRVLKVGGKMIIVESCVPLWFYKLEKLMFPLISRLVNKIFNHPATLQYPSDMIESMLKNKFKTIKVTDIPLGRWVLIYGFKVPTFFTPVSVKLFVAEG